LLADEDFEVNLTELVNGGRDFINDFITKTATINKKLGGSRRRGSRRIFKMVLMQMKLI